jgi:ribonuclease HI
VKNEITIYTDGAAKGNPGPAGIGFVAHRPDGTVFFKHFRYIGEATNNVAEYTAFIEGLKKAVEKGIARVRVASDSELLVRQMLGVYKVKNPHLKKLYDKAAGLIAQFEYFEIFHVDRTRNAEADELANRAIKQHNLSRRT